MRSYCANTLTQCIPIFDLSYCIKKNWGWPWFEIARFHVKIVETKIVLFTQFVTFFASKTTLCFIIFYYSMAPTILGSIPQVLMKWSYNVLLLTASATQPPCLSIVSNTVWLSTYFALEESMFGIKHAHIISKAVLSFSIVTWPTENVKPRHRN